MLEIGLVDTISEVMSPVFLEENCGGIFHLTNGINAGHKIIALGVKTNNDFLTFMIILFGDEAISIEITQASLRGLTSI